MHEKFGVDGGPFRSSEGGLVTTQRYKEPQSYGSSVRKAVWHIRYLTRPCDMIRFSVASFKRSGTCTSTANELVRSTGTMSWDLKARIMVEPVGVPFLCISIGGRRNRRMRFHRFGAFHSDFCLDGQRPSTNSFDHQITFCSKFGV